MRSLRDPERLRLRLFGIYRALRRAFGHQGWWPGETPFEVMVGAILTQNTAWTNVERAIKNLKTAGMLSARKMHAMTPHDLARLIRPAGYYNIKADRLKQMTGFLFREYGGRIHRMRREKTGVLREKLLGVKGIGPETADSILLYALDKPSFVIDAYTRRVFSRHGIAGEGLDYDAWQDIFVKALPRRLGLYKDYHAQIVRVAKGHCRTQPRCRACPLKSFFEAAARKKNKIPRQ